MSASENEPLDIDDGGVHPAAVRLLNAKRELVIGADEVPKETDAAAEIDAAYERVESALLAIAALPEVSE